MKKIAELSASKSAALFMGGIIFLLVLVDLSASRQARAAPFQQTPEDVRMEHYNRCKDRYGPQLTEKDAEGLDQNCDPLPANRPSDVNPNESMGPRSPVQIGPAYWKELEKVYGQPLPEEDAP